MPERLIDANALMRKVCEKECGPHFNIDLCDLDDDSTDTRCVFREYVRSEPTIEAEPVRHARWVKIEPNGSQFRRKCSECGGIVHAVSAFCPDCGARMDATDTNVGGKGGMTNGDRIRSMTDEELAYFLTTTSCSICCDHPLNCGFDCASLYTIKAEKAEQEVSEDVGSIHAE